MVIKRTRRLKAFTRGALVNVAERRLLRNLFCYTKSIGHFGVQPLFQGKST